MSAAYANAMAMSATATEAAHSAIRRFHKRGEMSGIRRKRRLRR